MFIIVGVLAVGVCLCCGICLVVFGSTIGIALTQKGDIEKTIGEFMSAMDAKDADRAYALFSERGKKGTTLADIEAMLQGNNYSLFEGYESVHVNNINVNIRMDSNQDEPQGIVAKVSGTISYAGGVTGDFDATLERHGGKWQLNSINITVPPDKVSP